MPGRATVSAPGTSLWRRAARRRSPLFHSPHLRWCHGKLDGKRPPNIVSAGTDPPSFVAVLDEKTLAIPDRPGNHRLDTFENLLTHSEVGLFFMIPGSGDTLRVSGKGRIVRDGSLQAWLAVNGKDPNLVLIVTVEEAFMHCPKCIVRSRLWSPEHWPNRSNVPSLAEAIVAHAKTSETIAEVQAIIDDGTARLY